MTPDGERRARVALSFLAKPGDPVLGAALSTRTATEVLALVTGADADGEALLADRDEVADGVFVLVVPVCRSQFEQERKMLGHEAERLAYQEGRLDIIGVPIIHRVLQQAEAKFVSIQ